MNEKGNYAQKLDDIMSKSFNEWWEGLSKEELLTYLNEQPSFTADDLRKMFKQLGCTLRFGTSFSVQQGRAVTEFPNAQE